MKVSHRRKGVTQAGPKDRADRRKSLLTGAEREELVKKSRLTDADLDKLHGDNRRIAAKRNLLIHSRASDASDRAHSADATERLILPRLEHLGRMGAQYARAQSNAASTKRSKPFDDFLVQFLREHPHHTAEQVWEALADVTTSASAGELSIWRDKYGIRWRFDPYEAGGELLRPREGRPISFPSLKVKMSRLRRGRKI